MFKLPEVITENLKDYSNPDENLFAVYKYVNACMCDLISEPSDGPFYNFSKIFHYEEGELELEIKDHNLKDTEFKKGWLYDL